jgi:hypothetical protein
MVREPVEFRDGVRDVPEHVWAMLVDMGIETFRYTYEEAIRKADQEMLARRLVEARNELVRSHLARLGM